VKFVGQELIRQLQHKHALIWFMSFAHHLFMTDNGYYFIKSDRNISDEINPPPTPSSGFKNKLF